ncbi:hypothetical protein DFH29DRAFT_613799 [Suillus ampliporus]|nr:hypothetical protein DFH29DRAFT_613799 [Suillus ampliporus]
MRDPVHRLVDFWLLHVLLLSTPALEIFPSLDTLVSYGTYVLKARSDCMQDMYCTTTTSLLLADNDKINGCKAAGSMLFNLHGHLNDQLPTSFQSLQTTITKANLRLPPANLEIRSTLPSMAPPQHYALCYEAGLGHTILTAGSRRSTALMNSRACNLKLSQSARRH